MEPLSPQEKKTYQDNINAAYAQELRLLPENPTVRDNNRMHARISRLRKTLLKTMLEQKLKKLKAQNRNFRLLDAILSVKKPPVDSRTRIQLKTRISQLQQQEQSSLWKLSQQQQEQQDRSKKQKQWMLRLSPIRQTLPFILQQQEEEQQQQQQDVIKKYLSQQYW
uniref:Uncharacterized protein n=1 Tax=viral metagenome TaxID=1070528 RepID=A0A6C0K555_9ZZZZ